MIVSILSVVKCMFGKACFELTGNVPFRFCSTMRNWIFTPSVWRPVLPIASSVLSMSTLKSAKRRLNGVY